MTDLRTAAQAVDEAIFRKGYVNSKNRKDLVLIEALSKAVAESEGMVLVPSEPTDEMAHAAVQHIDEEPEYYYKWNTAKEVYKAMLAAAEVKP